VSAAPPATSRRSIGSGSAGFGRDTPADGVLRAGPPVDGRVGGAVVPAGGRLGTAATGWVVEASAPALTPATLFAGGTVGSGGVAAAAFFAGAAFFAAAFFGSSCVVAESDAAAAVFFAAVPAVRTASAAAS